MPPTLRPLLLAATLFAAALPAAAQGGDHPQLPRYEGATLVRREADDFTDYALRTGKARATGTQVVEGALARLTYQGPAERSVLEVYRNYEDALARDGFRILFSCAREACGDIRKDIESGPRYMLLYGGGDHRYLAAARTRDGKTFHVALWVTRNSGGGPARGRAMVQLDVVESGAMDARMTVVDADALRRDLADDGRVALYGIEFDVDRDTLRPGADAQIAQIAALLAREPRLSVRVEGHTDDTGPREHNLALSKRRAQRVVDALATRHGIARSRIEAVGRGAGAPLASNAGEEGRARNRRVEIVRR